MVTRSESSGAATPALAFGATALGLAIGFLIKYQCIAHPWVDSYQYTHFCYNEIQALFGVRGIGQGLIPYVDTRFEYPVVTGMFMYLAGAFLRALVRIGIVESNSDSGYLAVTSLLFAPLAFLVTGLLRPRVTRDRLMIWAIGAPTILYVFHNWDLLAVCGLVWGLVALERRREAEGGAGLAVGASAKLFPAFFLPGAILARWDDGDRPGARRLVAGFAGAYLLLNVPWIVVSGGIPRFVEGAFPGVELRAAGTNGWLAVWGFHAGRYPDYWTVWYWIAKYGKMVHPAPWWEVGAAGYRDFVNLASLALFAAGSLWLLYRGWRRRDEGLGYPMVATGFGIVALFLLTSKVYSPQYALWMAPLLAMLSIPWRLVVAYLFSEVAVLVAGFMWFTVYNDPNPGWQGVLEVFVWLRALILVLLIYASLYARRLHPAPVDQAVAEPAAT